jgi:putative component of membrane protein insertase Oxa1/YidC/SpoIIIJ protein YidD
MKYLMIGLIRIYQYAISPFLGEAADMFPVVRHMR